MTTKPFPYQREGAKRIVAFGRAYLADQMGLGKSLQAILAAKKAKWFPLVVVCPASLKWNWARECSHHFGLRSEVLAGTKPGKAILRGNCPVTIANYDILPWWLDYLRGLDPKCVVLDEAHYLQGRTTRRTKACQVLCHGVEHIIALSGTPLTSRPAELWPTLNILRPDLFPNFWPFAMRFCKPRRTPWGWDLRGASHLGELHSLLTRELMIRRRKEDVLKDLPEQSRFVVPLEIARRREYDAAVQDFRSWMRKKAPGKFAKAVRAEALTKVGYLKRLAAKLKLNAVLNWIDNFLQESEGKLVLFAVHKKIIAAVKGEYPGAVVVDGSTSQKRRKLHVDKFQNDAKCRLFVGNVRAAGVGLNLTAGTAVAFAELSWTPGEHTQAEKRIDRIGQKQKTSAYYLVGRGTIEEQLCSLIQRKQENLTAALDGGKGEDLNIFDQLCQLLREGE